MRKLLLLVILCTPSAALLAQQGQTGIEGLQFGSPLRIAGGRDNNFLVDRTNPNEKLLVLSLPPSVQSAAPDIRPVKLDDTVLSLTLPRIVYQNLSRRHEFITSWVPEFELYKNNSDQNAMSQEAYASFNYYLRRNLQIWVGDTYQTSKDPARTLSNVFLLLPRGRYRDNVAHGSLDFQPNPLTNLAAEYDTSYTKFGQTDVFQSQILDTKSSGYSFTFARMLSRKQRLSVKYSLFKILPINRVATNDDAVDAVRSFQRPINSVSAQYHMQSNPSTYWGVSGGVIKLANGTTYTVSGAVNRRLGNFWAGASYMRGLTFETGATKNGFARGLDSYGFYEVVVLQFKGQPSQNTAVLFDTTLSRGVASWRLDSSRGLMGRLRLDYRVSDRSVLFTTWESFAQSQNAFVQAPLTRNRIMAGIEFSLSSESSRRTSNQNQDAQYVALTNHQIRRRGLEED